MLESRAAAFAAAAEAPVGSKQQVASAPAAAVFKIQKQLCDIIHSVIRVAIATY